MLQAIGITRATLMIATVFSITKNNYKIHLPQRLWKFLNYKKDPHNITLTNLNYQEEPKINQSLCRFYNSQLINYKNCEIENEYTFFFTTNSILKFCFKEHSPVNIVTHQQDLKRSISWCWFWHTVSCIWQKSVWKFPSPHTHLK